MRLGTVALVTATTSSAAAAQTVSLAMATAYPPYEYALTGLATIFFVCVTIVLGGLITGLVTASLLELGLRAGLFNALDCVTVRDGG